MPVIYKISPESEWIAACAAGRYEGLAGDRRDGFIHFSAAHQLAGTLAKHFPGREGLVLAAFAADALGPALKWEASRGGERFPHLYGGLDPAIALWLKPLPLVAGAHRLPDLADP
jgi:uncharacterized protein (DUF952 family)